jgi:RNA polymerase sigma factor (sigma-70 family)
MTEGSVPPPSGVYRSMHVPSTTQPDVAPPRGPARPEDRPRPVGPSVVREFRPPGPGGGPDAVVREFRPPGQNGRPDAAPAPPGTVVRDLGPPGPEFADFYRTAWPSVARALSVALGDRDLAVDATDEAMARAYPRWDKLRRYDNPAAWVYRVGLNWARSYHRRLARRLPFAHPETTDAVPIADPAVHEALLELPLRLRSVVVCRLLLDWSIAETAEALGVRPGTVRSRLHRALESLKSSLHHLR